MQKSSVVCVAAVLATGCISTRTWSALEDVERELALDIETSAYRGADTDTEVETGLAGVTGCDDLVAQIVGGYPGLGAPRGRARAALAMARSEGALPAPEVMLEVWDFPIGDPQMANREGMYMIGIEQDLPPAGLLDGRARAAVEEASMALGELAEARRRVRLDAALACADWGSASAELIRLRATAGTLERMQDVMTARFSGGSRDMLADLARLDGERARVEREIAGSSARRIRAEARLNAMLGRSEGAALPGAPELGVPGEIDAVDALFTRALEARGEVQMARARARAAAARASAAESEASTPMFSVRATYMQVAGMRTGLGAAIGMTLPWLWSGEGAARDAARLEAESELERTAGIQRDLRIEIVAAARDLSGLLSALEVLRVRERPAAERALEAVAVTYTSGEVDFVAWIDAARALRDLEVEEARLLGEVARAQAELEGAVGGSISPEEVR